LDIRKVHIVFKTHLDIGFTDFSANVTDHFLNRYIPSALTAAREANRPGQPKRFIWTVGSFMLDLALRTLSGGAAEDLDDAIRRGDITYHALPFTTHSELCGRELFQAGLDIARRLDTRYGKKTIAAKMSDVPGHTIGIVGPLADQGIEFLHIGINNVACMPTVPALFMWENREGQRVMVNYARGYGGLTAVEGHDEALYFLHSDDNMGPPSQKRLHSVYKEVQARFPGAEVAASTLDAFAKSLRPLREKLPVIRQEIGDTWIHGIGTDPRKTAMLRELERLSRKWDETGTWARFTSPLSDGRLPRAAFLEQLLLICEHTWGLDTKKFLTDFVNWTRDDFDKARAADRLPDRYGAGTAYEGAFRFAKREFQRLKPKNLKWHQRSYSLFEMSHQEQRDYAAQAVRLLPRMLRDEAETVLKRAEDRMLPAPGGPGPVVKAAQLGAYRGMLRGEEIALHTPAGHVLLLGLPLYQETGLAAYERLEQQYLSNVSENRDWAVVDNMKPGAQHSDAPWEDVFHKPRLGCLSDFGGAWRLEGQYDPAPRRGAGCPEGFTLRLAPCPEGVRVSLLLYGKPANRKPEALFLPVSLKGARELSLRKIGQWIDPSSCAERGNQRVHGMDAFEWVSGEGNRMRVTSLHAPLIAIGQPKLLDFGGVEAFDRVYVNLYNNLWGTNYKMWYGEDIFCEFLIEEAGKEGRP